MNETVGYAVFFFAPALEALGDAVKPYLQEGPAGVHVPCREVDTGGAFIEMTLEGRDAEGRAVELELMVPSAMVRMIVSVRSDEEFGFQQRRKPITVLLDPVPHPVTFLGVEPVRELAAAATDTAAAPADAVVVPTDAATSCADSARPAA